MYGCYAIPQETKDRIDRDFTYHSPKNDQPQKYEELRAHAKELALLMNVACPPSRELSLAMTKLEEAVFWANAAIARNE